MPSPYLRQLYQLYLAEDDAPQGLVTQEAYQMLMQKGVACEEQLLDALDDDDDVQNAWHSLENEEDLDR